jgi:hypothetical protein
MSNTPHVVYQDERVTEYADGTEEVRFSDDEYKIMARSPRYFGLVLQCGHALSAAMGDGGCGTCESLFDAMQYAETEAEMDAIYNSVPRAPADLEVK